MRISTTGICNRRRFSNGWTFLEIVVVLFLVGLLLVLVYPNLQALSENRLSLASRQLAGTIQSLYHKAVATRQVHRLAFYPRSNAYQVQVVRPDGTLDLTALPESSRRSLPRGIRVQDVVTPRQGKVTGGEVFTNFSPVGLVDRTVIHLTDQDGHAMTLRIQPLTGRVRILEGYVEFEEKRHAPF